MRISDWSSDVCSSDLADGPDLALRIHRQHAVRVAELHRLDDAGKLEVAVLGPAPAVVGEGAAQARRAEQRSRKGDRAAQDEKATPCQHLPSSPLPPPACGARRSEEHTSELQSLMRI